MPLARFDRLPQPAQKALRGDGFPKFAATKSNEGIPNVVPLLSTSLADENTLIFVRMMIWKTARNLLANGRITINVIGPGLYSWIVVGEFAEFVRQGPFLDYFNRKAMFRYNAYTGAGEVGVIRVREARGPVPLGLAAAMFYNLLREPVRADGHGGHGPAVMPGPVLEKFNRRLALKHLGFVEEDGTPVAVPCLDLHARSANDLAFVLPRNDDHPLSQLRPGMKIAASVFTLAPVAYQVKGVFTGEEDQSGRRQGVIHLQESYTAAPPVPGRRIFPPEL
jgi:hypothetical protein